ncbi:MAG: glycosyltransferase family 39 protein [Bdellovibrionota bacterium]|jgi:hypothetical protein
MYQSTPTPHKKSFFKKNIFGYLCFGIAALGMLSFFTVSALQRLIAKDEGYYLMAAMQVISGKNVYFDFFYPQMPLLPYVYAVWIKLLDSIVANPWISARALSALLATGTGLLLYGEVRKRWGSFLALSAIILYTTCNYVFPWNTTVTTYALSSFLLFASYRLLSRNLHPVSLLIAGALFGLSIETRLLFAGLLPFFLFWLALQKQTTSKKITNCTLFCLGGFITLLPAVFLFVEHFDIFTYNNLGYHLERSTTSWDKNWEHLKQVFLVLFGIRDSIKYDAPQIQILLYSNLLGIILSLFKRRVPDLAFFISCGLFIINFLPKPTYIQYFSTLIPFLIIGVLVFFTTTYEIIQRAGKFGALPFFIAVLLFFVAYLYHVPADYLRYTKTGEGVIGIYNKRNAALWNLERLTMVANAIDRHTSHAEYVFSFWPGFLINTHTLPLNGMENHFAIPAAEMLQERENSLILFLQKCSSLIREGSFTTSETQKTLAERRLNYHIITTEEALNHFTDKNLRVVILETKRMRNKHLKKALETANLKKAEEIPPVIIYKK